MPAFFLNLGMLSVLPYSLSVHAPVACALEKGNVTPSLSVQVPKPDVVSDLGCCIDLVLQMYVLMLKVSLVAAPTWSRKCVLAPSGMGEFTVHNARSRICASLLSCGLSGKALLS